MERRGHRLVLSAFAFCLVLVSCDKTEAAARKFIKEGTWTVTSMTAGTTVVDKLPKWVINPCENHLDYCTGTWQHPLGSSAHFHWKFSNLGGNFEFMVDSTISETATMAYAQCVNFSGEYKVVKSKNHTFHFTSDKTFGYPGKTVSVFIERGN